MAASAGTLERIAVELAQAVGSLRHWVSDEQIFDLLAEFGVRFPDSLLSESMFAESLAEVRGAVEALDDAAAALGAAIASPSGAASLAAATLTVLDATRLTLDRVQSLGDTINSVGRTATDIPDAQIDRLTNGFSQKLLHFLIVDQVDIIPVIGEVLTLIGLIDRVEHGGDDSSIAEPAWTERILKLDRTGRLLTDTAAFFEERYGWGSVAFDGARLFGEFGASLSRLGVPSLLLDDPQAGPPTLEALVLDFGIDSSSAPPGLHVSAISPLSWDVLIQRVLPVPSWTFEFSGRGSLEPGMEVTIRPPLQVALAQGSGSVIELGLALLGSAENGFLLLGQSTANGLSAKVIELRANLRVDGSDARELTVTGLLNEGHLSIDPSEADGFLSSLVAGIRLESEFDLAFSWTLSDGLRLDGGTGLVRDIVVGARLGPVEIPTIRLAAEFDSAGTLSSEFTASIATDLGIFALNVDHIGFSVDLAFREDGSGNAGMLQLDVAFRPPDGVGLAVDAGVVAGGGFLSLDPALGRYAGAAALHLITVDIAAIGLVETKLPGGGWSMFLSLSARFVGVQLGLGFTLNGVGGLIGIHRGLDEDALADAVRTGSLDAVLFPEDAVADAPRILAEIDAIFPPVPDQYVFGPVVKVGWGTPTLVEIDVGVVIQLPEPLTISLLGALEAVLPDEAAPILELNAAFAGTLNLTEGTLKIDASLSGSKVAGFLITGDMSVRLALAGQPSFLVSFGGFHPAFDPPASFPRLERLAISLDTGDTLQLSLGGYFALSSNSIQFGAFAYFRISEAGFTAEGGTSFDALIIYRQFGFTIGLSVWVSISAGNAELLCIELSADLTGPNPWHVVGEASFKILGIKQSIHLDLSFGEHESQAAVEEADVQLLLEEELARDDAWSVLSPAGTVPVIIAPDSSLPAIDPAGRVQVGQRIVPLDRAIERYGNADLAGEETFSIEVQGFAADEIEDVEDWFGSEHYFRLDADERLSAPSFTLMKAGMIVGGARVAAPPVRSMTYDHEIAYKDPSAETPRHSVAIADQGQLDRALAMRSDSTARREFSVADTGFAVCDPETGAARGPHAGRDFFAARAALATAARPQDILVPAYELELLA